MGAGVRLPKPIRAPESGTSHFLSFFLQKISNPGLAGALQIKRGEKKYHCKLSLPLGPSATVPDPAVTSLSPPTSLCPLGPPLRHRVTSRRDSFRGEQALGALGVSGTIRGTNPGSLQPPGPGVSPPWMSSPPPRGCSPPFPHPPAPPARLFPVPRRPKSRGGRPGRRGEPSSCCSVSPRCPGTIPGWR